MPLGREHRFWWHISGAVSSGEQTGRSMGSELSVPTESPSVIQRFSGAQWPRPGTVSLGQGAAPSPGCQEEGGRIGPGTLDSRNHTAPPAIAPS